MMLLDCPILFFLRANSRTCAIQAGGHGRASACFPRAGPVYQPRFFFVSVGREELRVARRPGERSGHASQRDHNADVHAGDQLIGYLKVYLPWAT